jgi:hypothetical protein
LAAKLTGWKIDIRSALAPEEKIDGGVAEAESENINKQETETNKKQKTKAKTKE